jgi:two-component sensor histidine kinase
MTDRNVWVDRDGYPVNGSSRKSDELGFRLVRNLLKE